MLQTIANIVFPPLCGCCRGPIAGARENVLCVTCWKTLHLFHAPWCYRCGLPFAYEIPGREYCDECNKKSADMVDMARSVAAYQGSARTLVLKLKHADATYLAPLMASLMQRVINDFSEVAYVLPVPLHWRRLLRRRYNQSALLAYYLARDVHLPYAARFLKRHRATPTQGGRDAQERHNNVKNAFSMTKAGISALRGKNVLLVDDVWTTGATLASCAKTLKKAGVAHVYTLTFARVLKEE